MITEVRLDEHGFVIEAEGANWGLGTEFLQPRQVADLAYLHGFAEATNLATIAAICFAESQAGVRAWHDNLDADGNVLSRDVGLWQINIPASEIGTATEEELYDPNTNCSHARELYLAKIDGGIRAFTPWAAYNSGVYLHDPYAGKGILGVTNFLVQKLNGRGATLPLPLFTTHDLAAKLAA
jgi:Lysozyme like domain